jgi:hypothetical protein
MFITVAIASNEHCIFDGKLSIPLAEDLLRNSPMNQLFCAKWLRVAEVRSSAGLRRRRLLRTAIRATQQSASSIH